MGPFEGFVFTFDGGLGGGAAVSGLADGVMKVRSRLHRFTLGLATSRSSTGSLIRSYVLGTLSGGRGFIRTRGFGN